jgi:hypothetical protein
MKKFPIIITLFAIFTACQPDSSSDSGKFGDAAPDTVVADGVYGKEISPDNSISVDSLENLMTAAEKIDHIKVTGEVTEVCQAEGCWLAIKKSDGSSMRVTFSDHKFLVPKDIAGKIAVIEGAAYIETTSVEDLRHFAEDEGKSKEEIAAISQPKQELVFDAHGVMIR